ncbi:MAG TPA: hypothetical protein VEQ40_13155, partial [Pyrinomonadaceae bacterium]|nr:hypothetical protein [Pyrinomonadaceae bacterium]
MLFKLTGILSCTKTVGFRRRALRLGLALTLAVLFPIAASAYTIVMRGGRRIEIPSTFIVTSKTLTYEAAPGINVTLMMTGIDIAATERANNEPPGSLLRRAQGVQTIEPTATLSAPSPEPQARRTLTNKDLEASRRARQQSEADYERRRIELGLPSLDEARRRTAEEAQRAREQLRESEREEAEAETYWRGRASALRSEIAALDAEINYLRERLSEETDYINVPFTSVTTVVPTFRSRPVHRFPRPVFPGHPGFTHGANSGFQVTGRIGFGGGLTRSRVLLNARHRGGNLIAPPVIIGQGVFVPPLLAYSVGPISDYYYPSYERAALIARLREIEATRAGLHARW